MQRKNLYYHELDLETLRIRNMPREEFRVLLEKVKYRGYEVEQLVDGRKIVITKPGGKFVSGVVRREDFMVWVYDPSNFSLWLISHKDIRKDLEEKGKADAKGAIKIIDALEKVCAGEEPDDVMKAAELSNPQGESPELSLKAYKWI